MLFRSQERASEAEHLLGGDSETAWRLLGENPHKNYHTEYVIYTSGSVRILFRECNGNRQRGDFHRGSENHGHYDKDQGITVLYEIQ